MYISEDGKTEKEVQYIVLQLAQGGALIDILVESGKFDEKFTKYYLKQVLEGLQHCH